MKAKKDQPVGVTATWFNRIGQFEISFNRIHTKADF